MDKMIIIGSPGSGKTVLSRKLGEKTGLPVYHLDAYYWKAGWVKTPSEEWVRVVEQLTAGDRWIIDGNYGNSMDPRMNAADRIVLLDLPRGLCIWRAIRRRLANLGKSRPDMGPDCIEKFDREFFLFLKYIWNFPARSRSGILEKIERHGKTEATIVLRSKKEVLEFLEGSGL